MKTKNKTKETAGQGLAHVVKKALSLLLAMVMLLSITAGIDLTAFAETSGDYEYEILADDTVEITKYNGTSYNITIPSQINGKKVTSIGESAFEECTNLTGVLISNNIKNIGDKAFFSCGSLTSVTIPNSVVSIGVMAFKGCVSLKNIIIPNSVTEIEVDAFDGCTSLENITISSNLMRIGEGAFTFTGYYKNKSNWEKGALYIGNYLISIDGETLPDDEYTIKSGTTLIADGAGCSKLRSVVIPNSVTSIGSCAFAYCSKLANITIPDSVASIGDWAFYETAYYRDPTNWSDGVLYIGNHLIEANGNLLFGSYRIKNGTVTIADNAFYDCLEITDITIPDSVTSIGDSTFSGCEKLVNMTIGNGVTVIGTQTMAFCTSLKNVVIGNSVTNIGEEAFRDCSSLTNITLPNSVTSIGEGAFYFCTELKDITISNSITNIGNYAFDVCYNLTINCYYNSYAHKYAEEQNIKFKFISNEGIEKINNYETKTITLSSEKDKNYLYFIPNESGKYSFYSKDDGYCIFCNIYDSEMNWLPSLKDDNEYYYYYSLEKGRIYYLVSDTFSDSLSSQPITGHITIELKHNHQFTHSICSICAKTPFEYNNLLDGTVKITNFVDDTVSSVTVPSKVDGYNITIIGEGAFLWNKNLKEIIIKNKSCKLENLSILPVITIYGYKNSTAEAYAKENGNKFVALDSECSHSWNSGKVTKAATCTANGVKTYTCTVCGETKTEVIKATGHKAVTDKAVAATCTKAGKTAGSHCSVCNAVITAQKTVPATGHSYDAGKVTKAPTATTTGVKTYTCTKCKATKTETIKATGLKTPTLKATVNANGTFTLSWNKVTGAEKYELYIKQADGSYKLMKTTTATSFTTAFATYGKQFSYKMRAVTGSVKSAYSSAVNATNNKKLQTPTLKVTVNANGTFTLSWNKVTGADKYELYIKQADGSYKLMKTTTATSFTTAFATYGKQFSYKMRAVTSKNSSATSAYSSAVNATNNKKLQTPALKVAVNANGTFTLSWNKVTGAEKYELYIKQADGSYKLMKTTTATSFTTAFATYGKQFSYKMRAVTSKNSSATSAYSSAVNATNNKKLQTPALKVAVNANGTFTLSWNKVTGAEKYELYIKQANGSYKLMKTTTSTSFTTAVAAKGKTYSYKVRAVTGKNKNAASNYSNAVNAKRK